MAGPLVGDADDERDRQATVTDFLDYTEHLPSDVERSLTLLRKQDGLAQQSIEEMHRLLAQYSRLPPNNDAFESMKLRERISYLFDLTQRRRESAAAEANRLNNEVQRQHKRLISVKAKLQALPSPPSRDPTPQLPTQKSPQAKRDGIRINLKVDRQKIQGALPRRPRYRKVTVPGEVLSPPNPGSPTVSELQEWDEEEEDVPPPPPPRPIVPRKNDRDRDREKERERNKDPNREKKRERPPKDKPKKEKVPGQVGTNVHSQVAGISTSNALSLLTPPPEGAPPGSKWAPWFRLTEYEMAKLRKRMKKNAVWAPSDTMIRRELVDSGRGHEAYQKAKLRAEETGEPIVDEDDIEGQIAGNRPLRPGEISADVKAKTTNKGMSLNVQKKEKKLLLAQQQEAMEARERANITDQRLGSLGQTFRTLFDRPGVSPATPTESSFKGQKRKRESAHTPSALDLQLQSQLQPDAAPATSPVKQPVAKKLKAVPPTPKTANGSTTTTVTTTIPTAPPAPSPTKPKIDLAVDTTSPKDTRRANSSSMHRPSLILKPPAPDPSPIEPPSATLPTRQSSRPTSRRASAGALDNALTRQSPRLKSATPAPTPTTAAAPTAASRRSKRPAPGPVQASQEGGAQVSVGKRKNAPKKKGKLNVEEGKKQEEYAAEEEIDPDEPRYCVCDGVSYGTMICCENQSCAQEWFHLECVGLTRPPGSRTKWWCPNCDPNKQKGKR